MTIAARLQAGEASGRVGGYAVGDKDDDVQPEVRACVAYIAGRLISKAEHATIYDYSRVQFVSINGAVGEQAVDVYDFSRGCSIRGNFTGSKYSLYHYGKGHFVDLAVQGNAFRGYDFGSGFYFHGNMAGPRVNLCDMQTKSWFDYALWGAPGKAESLPAESDHGVDGGGAAGGDEAGERGDESDAERGGG